MIFETDSGGGIDVGDIKHSLRFRGAQYLTKTLGAVGTTTKIYTKSIWFKRSIIAVDNRLLSYGYINASNYYYVSINEIYGAVFIAGQSGGTSYVLTSTQYHRDPTNWYHVCIGVDSTQAVAADRVTAEVNGQLLTFTGSYPPINMSSPFDYTSAVQYISTNPALGPGNYWQGYMARVCHVQGVKLNASSFGYQNSSSNTWTSKTQGQIQAVVDAGGPNSYMLDFDDGTSLASLGYDKSSKGNNWNAVGFSLTIGPDYDWMSDVPGNNYPTFSLLNKNASLAISQGCLYASLVGAFWGQVVVPFAMTSGKWYWEMTPQNATSHIWGICNKTYNPVPNGNYVGFDASSWGYAGANGLKVTAGASAAYGATFTTNDVIGFAFDADARELICYKNGVSQGVMYTGLPVDAYYPAVSEQNGNCYGNFGQRPFAYAPPSGFKALCQQNLPDPAVENPEKHFAGLLHAGTGTPLAVTGCPFEPDLIWTKSRSTASTNHVLVDSSRGDGIALYSNSTSGETFNTGFQVITADGFTADGTASWVNGASQNYVDWFWKAGSTATNTNGSITSQTAANRVAGFSIVTYTGTGVNATVGHGLDKAPEMIIVKNRTSSVAWIIYHTGTGETKYLEFATTAAGTTAAAWNNTAPTSTVFSVGNGTGVNAVGASHVAYCFASVDGFSKLGTYVGNGLVEGPFVDCGFRPAYVLVKRTAAVGTWSLLDATRDTYNPLDSYIFLNDAAAEGVAVTYDFTSTGFKIRTTGSNTNTSGGGYIYYAVAETAAKYSNAR